jgi:glycerophosphoryl diester phosphodiesterase
MTFRVPSFYKLGIDAVFSDFTDTAVKARKINFR